jgi:glyoxylase-like metal-dependent hydrolase (beta-lactamase superfamily II)
VSGRLIMGSDNNGDPWESGVVSDLVECVLAPNPSAWTLDGTNTWIVGAIGGPCVIIDPGPLGSGHREAISRALERRNAQPSAVLLTHGHIDHSEGATELADYLGVKVRAWSPEYSSGGDENTLVHGDRVEVQGADLTVLATPGHSSDSVCFLVEECVFTGDTVLGRSTSLIAHPDGTLADYLVSLQTLADVCANQEILALMPGHGPVLRDPVNVVEGYLAHRRDRLKQVRIAMRDGAVSVREIVERVYVDIPADVIPAAEATVLAQLQYLAEHPTV